MDVYVALNMDGEEEPIGVRLNENDMLVAILEWGRRRVASDSELGPKAATGAELRIIERQAGRLLTGIYLPEHRQYAAIDVLVFSTDAPLLQQDEDES